MERKRNSATRMFASLALGVLLCGSLSKSLTAGEVSKVGSKSVLSTKVEALGWLNLTPMERLFWSLNQVWQLASGDGDASDPSKLTFRSGDGDASDPSKLRSGGDGDASDPSRR